MFILQSRWLLGLIAGTGKFADVFCARSEGRKYVIKTILTDFQYYQDMQRSLVNSRYLRLSQDTIPDRLMFVYRYLRDHLLSLAQHDLPLLLTKRILKDALRGIIELHHQNIVHTGETYLSMHAAVQVMITNKS